MDKPADPLDLEDALKSLNLAHSDAVLVPISDSGDPGQVLGGSHWSLLVYSRRSAPLRRFWHIDSLRGSRNASAAAEVALALSRLVDPGAADPTRAASVVEVACSQQRNGHDCGLYVLGYCERVARLLAGAASLDPAHDGPLREALASDPDAASLRRRVAATIEGLRRSP